MQGYAGAGMGLAGPGLGWGEPGPWAGQRLVWSWCGLGWNWAWLNWGLVVGLELGSGWAGAELGLNISISFTGANRIELFLTYSID